MAFGVVIAGTTSLHGCCCNMPKFDIKCDECRKTIGKTDDMVVSAMGGKCARCKKEIKNKNWTYFD